MEINKGLTADFKLVNGKFEMKSGKDKADADMTMVYNFFGWFRIFKQDYCVNAFWIWSRTNTFVFRYQDIIKLELKRVVEKYLKFVKIDSVVIYKDAPNSKELKFDTTYSYKLLGINKPTRTIFKKTYE